MEEFGLQAESSIDFSLCPIEVSTSVCTTQTKVYATFRLKAELRTTSLGPLLPKLIKAGLSEVLRRHHNLKLTVGVETQEPRLCEGGDLRCALDIDYQNR